MSNSNYIRHKSRLKSRARENSTRGSQEHGRNWGCPPVERLEARYHLSAASIVDLNLPVDANSLSNRIAFNNEGQVVGSLVSRDGTGASLFTWDSGSFTTLTLPGDAVQPQTGDVVSINDVGIFNDTPLIGGYVLTYVPSLVHSFDIPTAWADPGTPVNVSDPMRPHTNGDTRLYDGSIQALNNREQALFETGVAQVGLLNGVPVAFVQDYFQPPVGGNGVVRAAAINNSGVIVGSAQMLSGYSVATVWDSSGKVQYTDSDTNHYSSAVAINDSGDFVGSAYFASINGMAPALWHQNGIVQQLPGARALDINNNGQVLIDGGDGDYYVWQNGSELPVVLPADWGWTGVQPMAINDSGQILGEGAFGTDPNIQAFILTPAFDPSTVSAMDVSATYGESDTISADLTSGGQPAPGETVSFYVGGNMLGTAITDNTGVATFVVPKSGLLAAGQYTVRATFTGDVDYAPSHEDSTLTINPAPLTIAANPNAKTFGQTATESGTVHGIQNADPITAMFASAGDAATAPPGSYPTTASLSDGGSGKLPTDYVVESDLSDVGTLTVNPAIMLTTSPLPQGIEDSAYNQPIMATDGTGDKTLAVSNIKNPIAGLMLPAHGTNSINITGTPMAVGTVTFDVLATDSVGATTIQSYSLTIAQPGFLALQPNNGSIGAQRSEVRQLALTFSGPVTLETGSMTLALLNTGGSGLNDGSPPTDASAALGAPTSADGGITWVIPILGDTSFSDKTGSLDDGVYTVTVYAAAVIDGSGNSLGGSNYSLTFHRLFGDINGDGTVNSADYFQFKKAFGSKAGSALYAAGFDFDANGTINSADYFKFKANFGRKFTGG